MGARRKTASVLMALFGALLTSSPAEARRLPSPVIFPEQALPIRFSHRQHLGFKLQCDFCHDQAESSVAAADNLTPGEESCASCHKIDRSRPDKDARPAARCDACHLSFDPSRPHEVARVEIPPPHLRFNHKVHADRAIPCTRCH